MARTKAPANPSTRMTRNGEEIVVPTEQVDFFGRDGWAVVTEQATPEAEEATE